MKKEIWTGPRIELETKKALAFILSWIPFTIVNVDVQGMNKLEELLSSWLMKCIRIIFQRKKGRNRKREREKNHKEDKKDKEDEDDKYWK